MNSFKIIETVRHTSSEIELAMIKANNSSIWGRLKVAAKRDNDGDIMIVYPETLTILCYSSDEELNELLSKMTIAIGEVSDIVKMDDFSIVTFEFVCPTDYEIREHFSEHMTPEFAAMGTYKPRYTEVLYSSDGSFLPFDGHKETTVLLVGFSHQAPAGFFETIEIGDKFKLKKEPDNPVDEFAIAVYSGRKRVAYVQRDDARKLYNIVEKPTECTVIQLNERSVKVTVPPLSQPKEPKLISPSRRQTIKSDDTCCVEDMCVFGDVIVGSTTWDEAERLCYKVEVFENTESRNFTTEFGTLWDHEGKGYFDQVYITHDKSLPETWGQLGLSFELSYNKWINKLKQLGFEIEVTEKPHTGDFQGHKTLDAEFIARNDENGLKLDLDFSYQYDYGYSVNSKSTLYSITFRCLEKTCITDSHINRQNKKDKKPFSRIKVDEDTYRYEGAQVGEWELVASSRPYDESDLDFLDPDLDIDY